MTALLCGGFSTAYVGNTGAGSRWAIVFSFLKGVLKTRPSVSAYFVLPAFYSGTVTAAFCLEIGLSLIAILLFRDAVSQHLPTAASRRRAF